MSKIVRPAILVVLVCLLFTAFGFRISHPHSGLKSALGSSSSSLAFYHHTSNVSKGDKIVVTTGLKDKDPALAIVMKADKTSVDIQAGSTLQRVDAKNVQGKLILVIPFVGFILNLVGL